MPRTQWTSRPLPPLAVFALVNKNFPRWVGKHCQRYESCQRCAVRDWRRLVGRVTAFLPGRAELPRVASIPRKLELRVLTYERGKAPGVHLLAQQAPVTVGGTWVDPPRRRPAYHISENLANHVVPLLLRACSRRLVVYKSFS